MDSERRQRFASEKHEYHDPRLLLGTWFDERARRETDFREFVDLYKRGELPAQKLKHYVSTLSAEMRCTESLDGRLLNGCIVGLAWQCGHAFLSALPKDVGMDGRYGMPCLATGAPRPATVKVIPARSAFRIFREDQRVPDSVPLMHNECLVFCHAGSAHQIFLNLDSADPVPFRNPEWVECPSSRGLWKVTGKDNYIAVNSPVVVHHVASGQRLSLDKEPIQSLLGIEYKVTCTFGQQEPDAWHFVAPCQLYLGSPKTRRLYCRSVWEILNERYL